MENLIFIVIILKGILNLIIQSNCLKIAPFILDTLSLVSQLHTNVPKVKLPKHQTFC